MLFAVARSRSFWLALAWGMVSSAWGQRVQFATPVEPAGSAAPAVAQQPSLPPTAPPGGWTAPGGTAPAPITPAPSLPPGMAPPAGPYGTVPTTPYGTLPSTPGTTPPVYPSPPAGLQGSIAPGGVDWYGNPANLPPPGGPYYTTPPSGYQQPGALFPDSNLNPNLSSPSAAGNFGGFGQETTLGQMQRLLNDVGFEFTWLAGGDGDSAFGMTSLESHAAFAFPFFTNQAPFIVTPGFAVHYLQGPSSDGADLPPRLYDAYLDTGWKPVVTQWLSADLGFRIGAYTDFAHTTTESIRLMGRGLGVVQFSPNLQIVAGVVYLDRMKVKLLPAGGIIWTPTPDVRYEILFPRPKLAQRWINIGTTEWWWYVAGEYGGGSWTVERVGDVSDRIDYNDIRVIGGLEWKALSGLRGYFEVGFVFEREILFDSGVPENFEPTETVMLRAGLSY